MDQSFESQAPKGKLYNLLYSNYKVGRSQIHKALDFQAAEEPCSALSFSLSFSRD
jgi:hypothetical protein